MSTTKSSTRQNVTHFLLVFALVYLVTQMVLPRLFPEQFGREPRGSGVTLAMQDATVKGGHHPVLLVGNYTDRELALPSRCPMAPVDVWRIEPEGRRTALTATETALPCHALEPFPTKEETPVDLAPWKYSLFSAYGTYEIALMLPEGFRPFQSQESSATSSAGTNVEAPAPEDREVSPSPSTLTVRFELYEAGAVTRLFRTLVTRPFLNFLIFVASLLPDHNLGVAIIVLTILVKLLLLLPTQHAMEGQRKLQLLQPKLDELRAKYKEHPEQMNKEIMALWKREGVNPMQSCLPMLLQFPVLIGLFFVVRDGSVLALSRHLIYPFYADLPWQSFGTDFLGLDLLLPNAWLFAPLLFASQFAQLKLSFVMAKRKKVPTAAGKTDGKLNQQELQQKMMLYGLPVMIAVFTFQFASAVSLYWLVSTIFAIGQQLWVNRKSEV